MKWLTLKQCSEWLQERTIIETPYSQASVAHAYRFQFEPPGKSSILTAFTRHLFDSFAEFSGALLVFDDWALFQPDEMALIDSLRRAHGEVRSLIDAPGHLFTASEQAEAIGHSYLSVIFGWTAHLYLASGKTTVLFWEGDLVDFWSEDEIETQKLREVIQRFELQVTYPAAT